MWVIIVFPPIAIPWGIPRPAACRRCGAVDSMEIHERSRRSLPYLTELANRAGDVPVVRFSTVGFRCRSCGARWTPPLPSTPRVGRVPRFHEAKIVVWYCLGDLPSQILAEMRHHGTPVSRATLYRVLARVRDPQLRALHLDNRRRTRRAARRGRPFVWYLGSDIPVNEGDFADVLARPAHVIEADDGYLPAGLATRTTALVFHRRRTPLALETFDWIDRYLAGIGHAGVLLFRDRVRLDRAFPPEGPNPMFQPGDDIVLPLDAFDGRLAPHASPPVRNAINSALRIADMDASALRSALESGMRWANKRAFTSMGPIELEDLHEE